MTIERVTAIIALMVAGAVAFGSAAVVRFYAKAIARAPRKNGLLKWHVAAIGSAVTGTWVMIALGQLDILGILETTRWMRLVGYSSFGVLTVVALGLIGTLQRRRIHSETRPAVAAGGRRSDEVEHD